MIHRTGLLLSLGLLALGTVQAQNMEPLFSGVATFDNGLVVRYATIAEQPFADADIAGWSSGEVLSSPNIPPTPAPQRLQRFIVDSRRGIYFGYSLRVVRPDILALAAGQPPPAVRTKPFEVSIEPLALTRGDLPAHFRNMMLQPAKLRAYPQSRSVGVGDSLVVDLSVATRGRTSSTDLKLRETLRFSAAGVRQLPAGGN